MIGEKMFMFWSTAKKRRKALSAVVGGVLLMFSATSWAAVSQSREVDKIKVVSGKTFVLKSDQPVRRVFIADPEIAKADVGLSPREILVTGISPGVTSLTLWHNKTVSAVYDLEVAYDISRLKQELHSLLPEEKDLRVIPTHNCITLAGRISNAASLSQALALAEAFLPQGEKSKKCQVRNLVEVGGIHQVMLEVRVAEMQKSLVNRFGVNFNYNRGGDFGVTTLGSLTQLVSPFDANLLSGPAIFNPKTEAFGPLAFFVTPNINALFRFHKGNATWTGYVDALKDDGLAKVLAEPTLIALSGQTANFLAGGEFPVPVPQGLGTVAIEYKPFGVGLAFTPTVLSDKKISLKVSPEVSELDFSTAVRLEGFVIPGLTTRKAETVVELADGQSFAIAGLLKEDIRDTLSKYPFLGDIPVLGALFRSRAFQKNETELVIIATPHLVKPLDLAKQPLPTDFYIEPNDTEFYWLGLMEGRQRQEQVAPKGDLDGDFGHGAPYPN
jgi:pilus assembly protein CpaC